MKTGELKDPADGSAPYLETDDWTPWQYHAPEEELEPYYKAANALMMKLERMPPGVRARLKQIEIRCPVKGCLLATLYWIPRRPTAEELENHRRRNPLRVRTPNGVQTYSRPLEIGTYFYVGRTASGTEVYDIPFYGFSATPKDEARGCMCCRMVHWRAGCRHGAASLERNAMLGMFGLADRELGWGQTEEEVVARLPEHQRPFWGKRVFHPEPAAWHPKKRQRSASRQLARPLQMSAPSGGRR